MMLFKWKIPGNVYRRFKGVRNDKSKTPRCLSDDDGSFNELHIYRSNKSYRNYSVLAVVSSYYVASM